MLPSDIVYLVPTRGRPGSVPELAQAWDETGAEAKLIFCVDDDDPDIEEYLSHAGTGNFSINIHKRLRLAGTLNWWSKWFTNEYQAIGFMGDDHRPRTKGWDARFAECLSGGAGIVYGNDLLMGAKMPTAVCMTSDIPATLGYYCPPGFVHLCVDLVWRDWGEGMGRITYLDDVVIEHLHPANGKANLDAGYEEVNSTEMVSADSAAYYHYRDESLPCDTAKLRLLP